MVVSRIPLPEGENPYQKEYDELLSPTVMIETLTGRGSGVIIPHHKDTKDTKGYVYILTANHVVKNYTEVTVTIYTPLTPLFRGESLSASVVFTDTNKDLALLKIINPPQSPFDKGGNRGIFPAKLAPSNYTYYLFTPVYVVGCSLGLNPRPSSGIITAISLGVLGVSAVEVSSPILPGNSGGPVYDARTHELIGIAVWVRLYGDQLVTTMAGIVPISEIYDFLQGYERLQEVTKGYPIPSVRDSLSIGCPRNRVERGTKLP
jgi:S1-C subfamily serine protease